MKHLKGVWQVLPAVCLIFFLTSCCCMKCHKSKCPESPGVTCTNLILDGSFEVPNNVDAYGHLEGFSKGQHFGSPDPKSGLGVWLVADCETNNDVALFSSHYSDVNHLFRPTPDGINFVQVGQRPQGPNTPPYPAATLTQDIATPLDAGNYSLAFIQGAFLYPGLQQVEGFVHVELAPTGGGSSVYQGDFPVGPGSVWVPQSGTITLKPSDIANNPSGKYTIKIMAIHGDRVAVVDAISLCKKH